MEIGKGKREFLVLSWAGEVGIADLGLGIGDWGLGVVDDFLCVLGVLCGKRSFLRVFRGFEIRRP